MVLRTQERTLRFRPHLAFSDSVATDALERLAKAVQWLRLEGAAGASS